MKKGLAFFGILMVLVCLWSGCAGTGENTKTTTHRFLEHAGIDWFNF